MIPPHGCFMPTVYVVAGATLLLATSAGSAAPLPTRDQNPLLAGFGLPMPLPTRFDEEGQWSVAADVNWASTALAQQRGAETLVFDAETQEVRLTLQHILSDRFALRLQVPYRHTGGGSLDSVIDSFHDISGTSEGARPDLPPDQIRIEYTRLGSTQLNIASSSSGWAGVQASLGWKLAQSPAS